MTKAACRERYLHYLGAADFGVFKNGFESRIRRDQFAACRSGKGFRERLETLARTVA